ncbi:MAG: tail fiber protein [Armatimonadota bacterium]
MSQPFVGEIKLVGFNFAPQGWATCDGQVMSIAQNDVLFALIGTTYGGDGQQTFSLPDLRGRVPVHADSSMPIGSQAGEEGVTLTANQTPVHTHAQTVSSAPGDQRSPGGNRWARELTGQSTGFASAANINGQMQPATSVSGQSQPHTNIAPFLTINFVISLFGIFPSQN